MYFHILVTANSNYDSNAQAKHHSQDFELSGFVVAAYLLSANALLLELVIQKDQLILIDST